MIALLTAKETDKIALRGVKIAATLAGLGARVTVEQTFVNQEEKAIEAIYTFPLPDGAAVCGFEIITADRVLTGAIEEREQAELQYEQAQKDGHGVFMAESFRPDVFSTRVGNLKPRQAVTVKLTYVSALAAADRTIRVTFPATVAPRFVSGSGMDPIDAAVDGDALNPPHVLSVPYGLTLEVDVDLGIAIRSIGSATHGVRVENVDGGKQRVTLHGGIAAMNKDIVLELELAKEAAATGVWQRAAGRDEIFSAVTFVPTFEEAELPQRGAAEVVFIVDCSGSMGGDSIRQAKAAIELCLRSLNLGDRFNIVRFGSTHQMMARESMVYSDQTLRQALAYVAATEANLGGTEIYEPLRNVIRTPVRGRVRDVILLTDGQVSNEPAVIELARQHRGTSRIFSFGIGRGCSAYLINGLARVSGGAAEFVTDDERIDHKVLRMFSRIASPMVTDVRVEWGTDTQQASSDVPAIFDGDAVCVYGRSAGALRDVTLRCKLGEREKSWKVSVREMAGAGQVSLLWARERIRHMEESRDEQGSIPPANKTAAAQISKAFGVLCATTAFIAVEHRSVEERTKGMPALRRVPVAVPLGWHEGAAPGGMLGFACAAPAAAAGSAAMDLAQVRSFDKSAKRRRVDPCKIVAKASPAEEAKPKLVTRDLLGILQGQSAEGWFAVSWLPGRGMEILNGAPVDLAEWQKELEALGISGERVIVTAMAMRIFLRCYKNDEVMWRRAFDKAKRWLSTENAAAAAWAEAAAKVAS